MNKPVQHRRKLNTEQVVVLELLYKFRFGSNDLIAQYFGKKDRSFVFRRLSILHEQGLIGKRFEPSYRLQGKPAAYYLLPEGARVLKQHRDEGDTDGINIKGIYKDATISERFVNHCFTIFALYNRLMVSYGDELDFLSKSDLAGYDNFPSPFPDAYLTLQTNDGTKHFFLDVLDDDAHLLIDASKKIKRYLDYRQSGDWAIIGGSIPVILFACNTEAACEKVQKRCDALVSKAWMQDIDFRAVTLGTVKLG
jgi:hypothetical protein